MDETATQFAAFNRSYMEYNFAAFFTPGQSAPIWPLLNEGRPVAKGQVHI